MPCIGQSLSFNFDHAQLVYSNLGGLGPDLGKPPSMRYVNVAKVYMPDSGAAAYLDLEVVNMSTYTPLDTNLNGMSGRMARLSFASAAEATALWSASQDAPDSPDTARRYETRRRT